MEKIRAEVGQRFKVNFSHYNMLKNVDTGKSLPWLQEGTKSRWFNSLVDAERWLEEEQRLEGRRLECPDTKFMFQTFMSVQIKVILDNQPLQVDKGLLPGWL